MKVVQISIEAWVFAMHCRGGVSSWLVIGVNGVSRSVFGLAFGVSTEKG